MEITALGGAGARAVVLWQNDSRLCPAQPIPHPTSSSATSASAASASSRGAPVSGVACQMSCWLQVDLAAAAPDPCLSPHSLSQGNMVSSTSQIFSLLYFPGLLPCSAIQSFA